LGASGMLGKALVSSFKECNDFEIIIPDRSACDISNLNLIEPYIVKVRPDIIINAAAVVNIQLCESEKDYVFRVNAESVSRMAFAANKIEAKLIQISTDHYYYGGKDKKHTENDSVCLLNNYAYTKFVGENYARLANRFLIVRTNIVGFKGSRTHKTFIEWAVDAIKNNVQLTLFDDYYTSTIDIYSFSEVLKKIVSMGIEGVYNVASSDVTSKARFINLLSEKLGIAMNQPLYSSVNKNSLVKRPDSLGLDVSKIEKALDIKMPSVNSVILKLSEVYYASK
jgi:dTDP-4-dehydrorhamnose reductase